MTEPRQGAISPTPHTCRVQGRAAEIARSFGYRSCGPEHLFLGMLHDGGWPVDALSDLVDQERAEAAVLAIVNGPGYTPPAPPEFPWQDGHVRPWGVEIAVELGDHHYGLEHALLAMLRDRECVPARALASLADLDSIHAALLAAKNTPPSASANAVFLPDGVELDGPLHQAINEALPPGTTYGFNFDGNGRTWINVLGSSPAPDDSLTREVLSRALASLARPPLTT